MRIVIVEDEYRTRQGIKKLLEKINPVYKVVGEADNGKLGLQIICEFLPDLIIMDIKMPEMDGLEMLTKLRELGVGSKAIIYSGFSDFLFAKKALAIGVCEYLLKPITVKDLERSLKKIDQLIEVENQSKQIYKQNIDQLFNNLLESLEDNSTDNEIQKFSKTLNIVQKQNFGALMIYYGAFSYLSEKDMKRALLNALSTYCVKRYHTFLLSDKRELIVLFEQGIDPTKTNQHLIEMVHRDMSSYLSHDIATASTEFVDLKNLKTAVAELRDCIRWSITKGTESIISRETITLTKIDNLQYPIEIENALKKEIYAQNYSAILNNIELFSNVLFKSNYSPDNVVDSYIRFATALFYFVKEVDIKLYTQLNTKNLFNNIIAARTNKEIFQKLKTVGENIILLATVHVKPEEEYSITIRKAINIIFENYMHNIGLQDIAAQLGISSAYLCTLFTNETGENLISFLNRFRIDQSKKMLISTELKVFDIAQKVGYQDPKYFNRVFKKYTGISPLEYRKQIGYNIPPLFYPPLKNK